MRTLIVTLLLINGVYQMAAQTMNITDKQIIKTATIPVPIDSVWKSWSTPEGIAAFLEISTNMKLERGGPYEWYFDTEDKVGLRGSEGCTVISFVPREMISFTWNAPPSIPYVRNHEYKTWVTVFFTETAEGTNVRLVHTGWPEGEEWNKAYNYFDSAWGYVLKALNDYWVAK